MVLSAKEFSEKMISENPNITANEIMIEFAKEHVKEALQSAHYAAVSNLDGRAWDSVYNKRFLLNAYPESKVT